MSKNLTVIRAENETGKTTMLTALQWAFYGDEALPGESKSYASIPLIGRNPAAASVLRWTSKPLR